MSLPSTSRASRSGSMTTPAKKPRVGAFPEEGIGPLGLLFVLFLVAATVGVLDYGVLPPAYAERAKAPQNIYARLDFRYGDPDELNRQRDAAAEKAPRVYREDPAWTDSVLRDLTELIGIAEAATSAGDARERARRYPYDTALVDELFKYNQEMGPLRNPLRTVLLGRIRASLQIIARNGILTQEHYDFERNKRGERREIIRLRPGSARKGETAEPTVPVELLRSVGTAEEELQRGSWRENVPEGLKNELYRHLHTRLANNLNLDEKQTAAEQERAREEVGRGDVQVKRGSLILSRDREVSKADLERLHAEYRAYKKSLPLETRLKHWMALGTLALAALAAFLFVASRSQPELLRRRRPLVMLGLLTLAVLAVARGALLSGMSLALAPFIIAGLVASLTFGQTVALLTLLALGVLTTYAGVRWEAVETLGGIPAVSLALVAGGIAAALPPERLQDRWDLLKYGAVGGLVQGLLVLGLSLLGDGLAAQNVTENLANGGAERAAALLQAQLPTLAQALLALANGPLCGLLVLGALPLIESLFGILTNIRLFELADMNQPALKRIQLEAPGTFAHTLQVRFLAEPAAAAIGANTRLVSAGCLYHDLGKVLKPEYFIENQMDAAERHQRLRPSVSALLITAHVKDGIDLAREYGLPQQIIDFIPEHHGTTLVSYFYHSAMKNAEAEGTPGSGSRTVQESFFRYPGPKPRSRETAILMLADTVEAASRTLSNPNAARLASFTHELVMEKVLDGQLDECGLTFRELALIEEAFLRVEVTRFHARIRYPGQPGEDSVLPPQAKTTIVEPVPVPGARPSGAQDYAPGKTASGTALPESQRRDLHG
ncbi:MAG: HDIG domain-containing metalloprotein [Planctomycetota bacterium]